MIKKLAVPARMGKVFASAFLALAFFISFHVDVFAAEVMLDKSTITWDGVPDGRVNYTRTLYVPDKVGVYAKNYDTVWDESSAMIIYLWHVWPSGNKEIAASWLLENGEYTNMRFGVGEGHYYLEVVCSTVSGDCDGTATLSSWDVQ